MTTDDIIAGIIAREGGYCDRGADRGGPTKFGITLVTLSAWRNQPCTAADVEAMPETEADAIYRRRFVQDPGFDRIADDALRAALVDAGVNHGPGHAVKWLQHAIGVAEDGVLGPVTFSALNALGPRQERSVLAKVLAARVRFYGRIVADDANKLKSERGLDTQGENAAGWLDRAASFIEQL